MNQEAEVFGLLNKLKAYKLQKTVVEYRLKPFRIRF